MTTWEALRSRLEGVEDRLSLSWADLDDLVGGLPPSAGKYPAFWAGDRSQWSGFRTTAVRLGEHVTFIRRTVAVVAPSLTTDSPQNRETGQADLILIGCVKSKSHHPTQTKDLYTSALFRKERNYAEASGRPWFILSAMHGLVAPDEVIEPYDVYLKEMPLPYRAWWGATVIEQLATWFGPVDAKIIEIHASAPYVDQIKTQLESAGASVAVPLAGLTMGRRLAWYDRSGSPAPISTKGAAAPALLRGAPSDEGEVIDRLQHREAGLSPREFIATGGTGLRYPGLYSWWVDPAGAATLSGGIGHRIEPGLIYAGLAGATHTRSGKESSNTLWGRIQSMHLGGRHEFSTFRRSLGSILANELLWAAIDEAALSSWMHEHLRVVTVPVADADTLDDLETTILTELDPPLNLMKMPKTPLRRRLSELRRQYGTDRSVS